MTVEVYLHSSLTLEPEVNLKADVRATFNQWNPIPARNPHLQETTSTTSDEVYVWDDATGLPDGVYAATSVSYQPTGAHRITHADMRFNRRTSWNHSLDFSVQPTPDPGVYIYRADSRKVATHEMGHAEGLGHTGISPAIMRQGAVTYYTVQQNDKEGIIAAYGAYP